VTWFIGFPTENETDARETWSYLRKHWDQIHLSLYTGTFGLGHDVPVFQHPEDYDIQIKFSAKATRRTRAMTAATGPAADAQGVHARSDIPVAMSGAALLYASNRPELLFKLRG